MLEYKNAVATTANPPTKCKTCGSRETKRGPGAGPHRGRLLCGGCGRFIKWLGKAEVTPGNNDEKGAAPAPGDWLAMPSD